MSFEPVAYNESTKLTMRSTLLVSAFVCIAALARSQGAVSFTGLKFKSYTAAENANTIISFKSNKEATYIMYGTVPFINKSFYTECPCTCKVSGTVVSINCVCEDKETHPEPIVESFTYDAKKRTLTSKRYQYTHGSAPKPELAYKYMIWNQQ